jgi:F420-dependent oxidoreductase-like protein
MRLGTQAGYGGGPVNVQHIQTLEKAGIDVFWVAELYSFDAVSQMGYLAAITKTAHIGSSILPFYSRTPTLLGMTAAGLDALSGERFILGIGSSGPQVIEGWHGLPFDGPVERVSELIDVCRKVWRREPVTHEGRYYTIPLPPEKGTGLGKPLKLINHPLRADIPIFVASLGPKNVEMTASEADGWIPIFFWPEGARDVWGTSLDKGAAKRDASLKPLEIVAGGTVMIGEGLEKERERARPMLALYIGGMGARGRNFYNDLAIRYGFEGEAKEIQDLYLGGDRDGAAAKVPADLLEGISLIGPEGYVKDRLAAFKEAGVTILNVNVGGPDATKTIEKLRSWID